MNTKQTIAIIGATGSMGAAISKSLAKGNYRLLLFASKTDQLHALAAQIQQTHASAEIVVAQCPTDASWEADIIILAVPYNAQQEIADEIRQVANQKIVISIANPLNETFDGLLTAPDTSAAEQLQSVLPNSKVIKAFSTVFAADFAQPVISGKLADAFIAGNEPEALQVAEQLVSTAGFNPVIAGDLKVSRTLENMTLLLIQLNIRYKYNWLAGSKILHH